MIPRTLRPPRGLPAFSRSLSSSSPRQPIKIVEVGPRDGLQNEKTPLSTELKVELIERLVRSGLRNVEAGSFVSPKWVPQMASTPEVLTSPALSQLRRDYPDLSLPVLVPNARGLSSLTTLFSSHPSDPPLTNEIAVFVAASEGFSRANLNTTVKDSLASLPPIFESAKNRGLKVRAYVSVVLGCPFDGRIEPGKVAGVAKELLDMGAYEVSLGDTIGVGVPAGWGKLLNECERAGVPVSMLAAHCHDTYGTAISSILQCVSLGVRTVDSSIASLGGCPYSPGATGNVSTEDVLYALYHSGIPSSFFPAPPEAGRGILLGWEGVKEDKERFERLCDAGEWVSERLGRANGSRVGRAVRGKRERDERRKAKEVDKQQEAKL
ncbi:hydroxymethylglutaryl-CoA lyase [Rhodotorula toruloides]|uniref:hydroxymethylglutaryl-CoA lyase n=1 Tax=Rhodotorula toruloides TaxID=5286 RepID=A0A511K8E9_RHOTO|nr:hydroxymethylglutaryl-CoA lyase [Rhodotorula toruloides]